MSEASALILIEYIQAQLERLVMVEAYHRTTRDPFVKTSLAHLIDDTQEAVARVSSRLRQLQAMPVSQISGKRSNKLLHQLWSRRSEGDKLIFIHRGLEHQLAWYISKTKALRADPDSQAIFAALTEEHRARLAQWEQLMLELKVSWNE